MTTTVRCAFACDEPAVGVVPTNNPDHTIRRRPICAKHVVELLPVDPETGTQWIQMFGAMDPSYASQGES